MKAFLEPGGLKGKEVAEPEAKPSSSFDLTLFSYLAWVLLSGSIDCLVASNQTCHQV
jgi:hypothetical protein